MSNQSKNRTTDQEILKEGIPLDRPCPSEKPRHAPTPQFKETKMQHICHKGEKAMSKKLNPKADQVAQTIMEQLGGNKFFAITGGRNLSYSETGLNFSIGKNKTKSHLVTITLNGKDLYDVTFKHVSNFTLFIDQEYTDVFNDQLCGIFQDYTGLFTSFNSARRGSVR